MGQANNFPQNNASQPRMMNSMAYGAGAPVVGVQPTVSTSSAAPNGAAAAYSSTPNQSHATPAYNATPNQTYAMPGNNFAPVPPGNSAPVVRAGAGDAQPGTMPAGQVNNPELRHSAGPGGPPAAAQQQSSHLGAPSTDASEARKTPMGNHAAPNNNYNMPTPPNNYSNSMGNNGLPPPVPYAGTASAAHNNNLQSQQNDEMNAARMNARRPTPIDTADDAPPDQPTGQSSAASSIEASMPVSPWRHIAPSDNQSTYFREGELGGTSRPPKDHKSTSGMNSVKKQASMDPPASLRGIRADYFSEKSRQTRDQLGGSNENSNEMDNANGTPEDNYNDEMAASGADGRSSKESSRPHERRSANQGTTSTRSSSPRKSKKESSSRSRPSNSPADSHKKSKSSSRNKEPKSPPSPGGRSKIKRTASAALPYYSRESEVEAAQRMQVGEPDPHSIHDYPRHTELFGELLGNNWISDRHSAPELRYGNSSAVMGGGPGAPGNPPSLMASHSTRYSAPPTQLGGLSVSTPPGAMSNLAQSGAAAPNNQPILTHNRKQTSTSKIDPANIPRPTGISEHQKEEGGKIYDSNKYITPPTPASSSSSTVLDRGSASCRFIRVTTNQMPIFQSTSHASHIPISCVLQPFATMHTKFEGEIPLVSHYGEAGPLRCSRCKAYVNPYFEFGSGGKDCRCNFCGHIMEVPNRYYCGFDENGHRRDRNEKAELSRGTVDYVAPRQYYSERIIPQVPYYVFVIDVSRQALESNFTHQVAQSLRSLVQSFPSESTRVAILTYDTDIHFYSWSATNPNPTILVAADVNEPFCAAPPETLFLDPRVSAQNLEALLDMLPTMWQQEADAPPMQSNFLEAPNSCGAAALRAATELLQGRGGSGQIAIFQRLLPTLGVGACAARDHVRNYGAAPSKDFQQMFKPQKAEWYQETAKFCLDHDIVVDSFLAPSTEYIDVATQSFVACKTGGDLFFYPNFLLKEDGEQLHYDISRSVVRNSAFGCSLKIRSSRGLAVEGMIAPFDAKTLHDQSIFEVSRLSADSTIVFNFKHDDLVESTRNVFLQAACLYTNSEGKKCIRVHTLCLGTTTALSNTFRYTCIDALTNILFKECILKEVESPDTLRQWVLQLITSILHSYRVNCAAATSSGQLILPESLKLLPLYTNSILKQISFRRSNTKFRVDHRMAQMVQVLGSDVATTSSMVYPKLYALHKLPEKAGRPTNICSNVFMPNSLQCSVDKVELNGCYLYENGQQMLVYLGQHLSQEFLQDAFGIHNISEALNWAKPAFNREHPLGQRLFAMSQQVRKDKGSSRWLPLKFVVDETRMTLAEDAAFGEQSYVDFLCMVHKKVQHRMD